MESKKKPVKEVRNGAVKIAIWENKGKSGEPFFSCTISRVYKDGDEWKTSKAINASDLANLTLASVQASIYIQAVRQNKTAASA